MSAPWETLWEVLSLRNYNTRLVIVSTVLLAMGSGLIGSFLLLRRRSLMADTLSHATLPGVGIAFAVMVALGGDGKFLPGLWIGASLSGGLGVLVVLALKQTTRLQEDVAMGLVLSVFFGVGVVILLLVQRMPGGSAAGLETFIYGKTASLIFSDFLLITTVSILSGGAALFLTKEWTLLCFDEGYGASQGWPMLRLDVLLLGAVILVTVCGLQAVGLILMIALFVIPAAAARFWAKRLTTMMGVSCLIGGLGGWIGGSLSALYADLPAGAVMVLVLTSFFLFSLLFAPHRGVVFLRLRREELNKTVGEQHLLRAVYEVIEAQSSADPMTAGAAQRGLTNVAVPVSRILAKRTWNRPELKRLLKRASKRAYLTQPSKEEIRLTEEGFGKAARITRNHRLWELYLVTHADIAPNHVDRDADLIEHVLDADLVARLEKKLTNQEVWMPVVPSLHATSHGQEKGGRHGMVSE